jgi:hypothetical protein
VQSKWKIGERRSVLKRNLDVISRPDKGERNFYVCFNVKFAHSSACTVCDSVDRITEIAKSGTKVFVYKTATFLSEWTVPKKYWCESVTFDWIRNKYIV